MCICIHTHTQGRCVVVVEKMYLFMYLFIYYRNIITTKSNHGSSINEIASADILSLVRLALLKKCHKSQFVI